MKNLCFLEVLFSKKQIADIWNFQWIKYLGTGLSYLKNWGIWVNHCSNYGASKLPLQFIEYLLYQLNNKHAKIAINSTIQHFEGCSENKYLLKVWRFLVHPPLNGGPVKFLRKSNGNHLLTANIFTNIRHLVSWKCIICAKSDFPITYSVC